MPSKKKVALLLPVLETYGTNKIIVLLVTYESVYFNSDLTIFESVGHLELLCKYYLCIPETLAGIFVLNIICDKATW